MNFYIIDTGLDNTTLWEETIYITNMEKYSLQYIAAVSREHRLKHWIDSNDDGQKTSAKNVA